MNLASAFTRSVERNSAKTAVFWGETEFTYQQLEGRARWVAGDLLQGRQIKPGDRVGLWLKNCPEFVPALFGIFMAGGVVVPINNFLKADEVNYILADAQI